MTTFNSFVEIFFNWFGFFPLRREGAGVARQASIFSLLAQSKDTKRKGTPHTSACGGPEMC
jgi:hypothetical protein